jgi:hypothetical protein
MATKQKPIQVEVALDVVGFGHRFKAEERERLAASCARRPQKIRLVREQENKYDGNAIAVFIEEGPLAGVVHRKGDAPGQIAYLRAETAAELAPRMDRGEVTFVKGTLVSLAAPEFKVGVVYVTLQKEEAA